MAAHLVELTYGRQFRLAKTVRHTVAVWLMVIFDDLDIVWNTREDTGTALETHDRWRRLQSSTFRSARRAKQSFP